MKAMIVFDIPEYVEINDCRIEYKVIETVTKAFMCVAEDVTKLKPMPEKYEESAIDKNIINYHRGFMEGFNDCIDEILGEE